MWRAAGSGECYLALFDPLALSKWAWCALSLRYLLRPPPLPFDSTYQQSLWRNTLGYGPSPYPGWTDSVHRDALGFKRIGRVPGAGCLKSYPDRLVDAIIYGRDLTLGEEDSDELVSEDRFEKIKFYLKHGKYPNGADRAEKSRLRSAATHYKLLDDDVLMLKDKEVISDPARQYEIARQTHALGQHAGINKTTATITERYHWRGIKDTVSDVIRVCAECEEKSNAIWMKPSTPNSTPNQTSIPNPLPASLSSASEDKTSSQDIRHKTSEPDLNLHHQEAPFQFTSFRDDPPPIDPQIMNELYTGHTGLDGQLHQNLQPSYFSPQAEMDWDPEARALFSLLNATSPIHDEENHETTDQDVELMLTRQLEEDAENSGAMMEVDRAARSFTSH